MKQTILSPNLWLLVVGFLIGSTLSAFDEFPGAAQHHPHDFTIPVEVESMDDSAGEITFRLWRAGQYDIYRKAPQSTDWGTIYASTPNDSTHWTDTNVVVGVEYEYKFQLITPDPPSANVSPSPSGDLYNYLRAGIKVDRTDSRGHLVLLVAEDANTLLAEEIALYKQDLVGDGWTVHTIVTQRGNVEKSESDHSEGFMGDQNLHQGYRDQIKALYATYGSDLKHVMLLGRVPMPMSGLYHNRRPDGHEAYFAYGADPYYSEMDNDEEWTDVGDNSTRSNIYPEISGLNVPGDGKFDLIRTPADDLSFLELGTSRVDMGMLHDEIDKLRIYLDKLHRYKHAKPDFRAGRKFFMRASYASPAETWFQAGASLVGWQNMHSVSDLPDDPQGVLGDDAAFTRDFGPFLFYCQGNGNVQANAGSKAVMWTGYQSYWGLWHHTNYMHDRIGSDNMLLSITYAARGHRWWYHPLGLGDVMGEATRISLNNRGINSNDGLYRFESGMTRRGDFTGYYMFQHIGDVAFRLFPYPPASRLIVDPQASGASLSWQASEDPEVIGYHVYRSASESGPFTRLTSVPVDATTYTDSSTTSGTWTYMVRAVKVERTGSGSYYNGSQGIFNTVSWGTPDPVVIATSELPDANFRSAYDFSLEVSGGLAPYTWSLASGSLPTGLTLDPLTGQLSGELKEHGTFNLTVQAEDSQGWIQTAALTLTVDAAVKYVIPILADSPIRSWQDANRGLAILGEPSDAREFFVKYDLSGLPAGTVTKAAIEFPVHIVENLPADGSTMTIHLTEDSHDVWEEGDGTPSTSTDPSAPLTVNNMPPINAAAPKALYTGNFEPGTDIVFDLTDMVNYDLTNDPNAILCLTPEVSDGMFTILTKEYEGRTDRISPRLIVYVEGNTAPEIRVHNLEGDFDAAYPAAPLLIDTTVLDDGSSGQGTTVSWTQISGPGSASFTAPNSEDTQVSFDTVGRYVIRITADNGVLSTSRDISVLVNSDILSSGPVPDIAWFKFDEPSGMTAGNSVPTGAEATLFDLDPVTAWSSDGLFGGALDLREASGTGYVNLASDGQYPIRPSDAWTISLWIKKPDLNGGRASILAKVVDSGGSDIEEIFIEDFLGEGVRAAVGGVYEGSNKLTFGQAINDGGWHLLTLRNDPVAKEMRLFVDAGKLALVVGSTDTTLATNSVDLLLGARRDTNNSTIKAYDDWDGLVDDLRIFGRALSLEEIKSLHTSTLFNKAPAVSISTDANGEDRSPHSLDGDIVDDGLPAGETLSYQWTKLSGPGDAVFADASAMDTSVEVDGIGVYTFRLTADDGSRTSYSDVQIAFDASLKVFPEVKTVDVAEGTTSIVRVKLADNPGETVTVTTARSSGDSDLDVQSGGTLVFDSGNWDTYQNLVISAAVDVDNQNGTAVFTLDADVAEVLDSEIIVTEVDADNLAPEISEGSSASVVLDEDNSPTAFSLTLNATDIHGDEITWSISSQASHGVAAASGTGTSKEISYTPYSDYYGSDSFVVQVADPQGETDTLTVNLTINSINDAPVINGSLADQNATVGTPFAYSLAENRFTDVEDASLSYTASMADDSPLPAWLSFDAGTQAFSGIPTPTSIGDITVQVTAQDDESASVSDQFVISVGGGTPNLLLGWDFLAAGGLAATTGEAVTVGSTTNSTGVSASTLVRGAGSEVDNLGNYENQGAFNTSRWHETDLAAAKANGHYYEFVLTPDAGKQLSLSSLDFAAYQQNTHTSSTIAVEYSFDGFATAGVYVGATSTDILRWNNGTDGTFSIDLSGISSLQNSTEEVTFRLYGYGFADHETKGLGQIDGNNTDLGVNGFIFDVASGGDPYTTWHDTIIWEVGDDTTPEGDPNGDGLSNLLSYAMDLDPAGNNPASAYPQVDTVEEGPDSFLTMTVRENSNASDLSIGLEGVEDLSGTWSALTPDAVNVVREVVHADVDGDGSAQLVTYKVKMGSETIYFLRMTVTQN